MMGLGRRRGRACGVPASTTVNFGGKVSPDFELGGKRCWSYMAI